MKKDFDSIKELWQAVKTNRAKQVPLWQSISRVIGINVDPQYDVTANNKVGNQLDESIDDPTAAISVNQAGDYLQGVVWGNGEGVFNLEPSDYVLEREKRSAVDPYFQFCTKRVLGDMNMPKAGLMSSMKPYFYDEVGFGTAGIGAFPNKAFIRGIEENPILFRNYGVDNLGIDEGRNGLVDIIFVQYRWRVNRIINEFAIKDGVLDKQAFGKLPTQIQKAYETNDANQEFTIVHGVVPRDDFNPRMKGKRGTRYHGTWFCDDSPDAPFSEEDYKDLPIAVCRAIRIRGDVWGRAGGTMLISTIRSVNYMVGKVIEIIEKQASPSLGMYNNALIGDGVLDTSADGLTIFNPALASDGKTPMFPLYDVGDPSNIIKFLIPYLNEKIATAFKIDILLDFAEQSSKTATEMMQRAVIRGKSLAGMLTQQKTEMLEPLIHRCVSIEQDMGRLGVDANILADQAAMLINDGMTDKIIPESVLWCIENGKPWYKIKFNNDLERLSRTERLEALMQMMNVITMIASVNPSILEAIDWYKLLQDFKEALNLQVSFILSADDFKDKIAQQAEIQAQAAQLQAAGAGAKAMRDSSAAAKDQAIAKRGGA